MVHDVMGLNLVWFPWKELQAEDVHLLFQVVDEYIVCIPKWGKKVSAAAFACFCEAPDILGVNRLI